MCALLVCPVSCVLALLRPLSCVLCPVSWLQMCALLVCPNMERLATQLGAQAGREAMQVRFTACCAGCLAA